MTTNGILISACVALVGFCGCSRDYEVNIEIEPKQIEGDWGVSSAPQVAKQNLLTNGSSQVALTLKSGGAAHYDSLPFAEFGTSSRTPASHWDIVSGEGTWDLSDYGGNGRHIWKVGILTSVRGLQLTLGKDKSGKLILVYTPDPDKADERVVLQQLASETKKH